MNEVSSQWSWVTYSSLKSAWAAQTGHADGPKLGRDTASEADGGQFGNRGQRRGDLSLYDDSGDSRQ